MKGLATLALGLALLGALTSCLGGARKVNPCANTRCEPAHRCVPLSQVGFCAKPAERARVTCNGVTADMGGACKDYKSQLENHPGCSCVDVK